MASYPLNDTDLWERVKQDDDPAAFSVLFERYWEEMFSVAYRRIADEEAAKDIVQNILIHTWENRRRITVEGSLSPYLFTALKYSVIRHIYKTARQGVTGLPLSVYNLPDEKEVADNDLREFEGLQEKIRFEIAAMPDRMREVFILNYEQRLSIKEIAWHLSISEQTVKNQLHTALKRLRGRLRNQALFLPFLL